jgi:hypothetical protein
MRLESPLGGGGGAAKAVASVSIHIDKTANGRVLGRMVHEVYLAALSEAKKRDLFGPRAP